MRAGGHEKQNAAPETQERRREELEQGWEQLIAQNAQLKKSRGGSGQQHQDGTLPSYGAQFSAIGAVVEACEHNSSAKAPLLGLISVLAQHGSHRMLSAVADNIRLKFSAHDQDFREVLLKVLQSGVDGLLECSNMSGFHAGFCMWDRLLDEPCWKSVDRQETESLPTFQR